MQYGPTSRAFLSPRGCGEKPHLLPPPPRELCSAGCTKKRGGLPEPSARASPWWTWFGPANIRTSTSVRPSGRIDAASARALRGGMTHPGKLQVRLMSCPSLVGQEIQPRAHLDPLAGPRPRRTAPTSIARTWEVTPSQLSKCRPPPSASQLSAGFDQSVAISSTFVTATHSLPLTRRAVAVSPVESG